MESSFILNSYTTFGPICMYFSEYRGRQNLDSDNGICAVWQGKRDDMLKLVKNTKRREMSVCVCSNDFKKYACPNSSNQPIEL